MNPVFDLLRLSTVSLDVLVAQRGSRAGLEQRQRSRLALLLDATLRGSPLYRNGWAPVRMQAWRWSACRWSRAARSWRALTTG